MSLARSTSTTQPWSRTRLIGTSKVDEANAVGPEAAGPEAEAMLGCHVGTYWNWGVDAGLSRCTSVPSAFMIMTGRSVELPLSRMNPMCVPSADHDGPKSSPAAQGAGSVAA